MNRATANTGGAPNPAPAPGPSLNARRQALLEIIVSDYIETAVPVASQQLARRYELRMSPATIRNDMAELEEMGYIARPHASAGGVPSDPGYRFYVDRAIHPPRLPRSFHEKVRAAIDVDEADPAAWAQSAARILAGAVQNLGVATTVKPTLARVKQVQLVHLRDREALLVIVMQEALIRQRLVRFDAPVDQETLTLAANGINRAVDGKGAAEVRALRDSGKLGDAVSEAVVAEIVRVLSDAERDEAQERYTSGMRHMLNQPEFQTSRSAQEAAEIADDDSLSRVIAEPTGPTEVRVVIGEESGDERLRPFSVVYASYGAGGDNGVIGAIGPTRMDYGRAISTIRYLATFLSELLAELDEPQRGAASRQ